MTSSDDPRVPRPQERPDESAGDQIQIKRIQDASAVAVGRGAMATAVYQGLSVEEVARLVAELKREEQPQVWDGREPYLGLQAFQEEDAPFFFGREALVDDLLGRVRKARFVVIAGPSGSGKSSLARAGLFYSLRRGQRLPGSEKWLLATMSPRGNPIEQLATAVSRAAGTPDAGAYIQRVGRDNPWALHEQVEALERMSDDPQRRFVLLVDQFEETFTQTKDEGQREAFINLLTTAAGVEDGRTTIVLSLRSDFVSNCALYPDLRAQINKANQFQLVGSMGSRDLAQAITLPALEVGAQIEPALVKQIIDDMKGEPGALPLMSFALRDLFEVQESAVGQPVDLTLQEYLEHGGIESALERHADHVFASFSADQRLLAKSIFSRLIEVGQGRLDTRRTAVFEELIPGGANSDAVTAVVRKLAQEDARLLITGGAVEDGDPQGISAPATVTIAHEKLIDAWPWLRRLVDENREMIVLQNQVNNDAQAWVKTEDAGFLYRGGRLMQVEEQLASLQPNLNALSQRFIEASLAQRAKERRQARRNIAIFVGLLLALFTGALFAALLFSRQAAENRNIAATAQAESTRAFVGEQTADAQRDVALSRQLAAQAQLHLDGPLDTALLLAVEATKSIVTVEGRHSLIQALTRNPRAATFLYGHEGVINSLAVSPDGRLVAAAGCAQKNSNSVCELGVINIWDTQTMQRSGSPLTGHNDEILSIAFSPDGALLASGGRDNQVLFWDVAAQEQLGAPLTGFTSPVSSLTFSPQGNLLASSSAAGIVITDLESFTSRELSAETVTNPVGSVAFSPNGEIAAGGGWGGQIHLWDVRSGQLDQAIFLDPDSPDSYDHALQRIAFSPDGQTLAAAGCAKVGAKGCDGGEIHLVDAVTGQEKSAPMVTENSVFGLAFSPDGQYLASGSCAELLQPWCLLGETRLWTIDSDGLLSSFEYTQELLLASEGWVSQVAFTPDSRSLAAAGDVGSIFVWNLSKRPLHRELGWESENIATSVAFSPDGRTLALADEAGQITIGDYTTGQLLLQLPSQHTMAVWSLAFSPDGRILLSGGDDGRVVLWDAVSGVEVNSLLSDNQSEITSVAYSPDGQSVAAAGCGIYDEDGTCISGIIHTWQDQTNYRAFEGHEGLVHSVEFSPDGKILASGGRDGRVIFWDVASGERMGKALEAGGEALNSIAFSPDGRLLAVAGDSRTITFWDSDTRQQRGQPLSGHLNAVSNIAFSPDGQTLASSACFFGRWSRTCSIGETYLWDVDSQTMIGQNLNMGDRVAGVEFSPDGLTLAAVGDFGPVDLWDVGLSTWQTTACQLANRNLTPDEWQQFVGLDIPYQDTCQE